MQRALIANVPEMLGLIVSYLCFWLAGRKERKKLRALQAENEAMKRLMTPREPSAGGVYREPTVTHHVLNEDHPQDCREKLHSLRLRVQELEEANRSLEADYNKVYNALYGHSTMPLHTLTGERTIKRRLPPPTRIPGEGSVVWK